MRRRVMVMNMVKMIRRMIPINVKVQTTLAMKCQPTDLALQYMILVIYCNVMGEIQ